MSNNTIFLYPIKVGDAFEYALFDFQDYCPTARYVGGTSRYLCECPDPHSCPGVVATMGYLENLGFTLHLGSRDTYRRGDFYHV